VIAFQIPSQAITRGLKRGLTPELLLLNVPSPWPEFAAYRLAHLKMRSGANEVEALREIDLLFERASHSEKTGPIPLIYRLAVLHRLVQSLIDKNDITQAAAKSDEVHGKL